MSFCVAYRIIMGIVAGVIWGASALTYKTIIDKEKASPFECGFDPSGLTRLSFCIKFFMVSVIFLVFDVEIALIIPMLFSSAMVLTFIGFLIFGAIYEWLYGGLDWLV